MLDCDVIKKIEDKLNYKFKDKKKLINAFLHSSYINENNIDNKEIESNERLEFLGDSVLSIIISKELYLNYSLNEKYMSQIKSQIISRNNLSKKIEELKLDKYLLLSKSHNKNKIPLSIKENLFEAIIGAVSIDCDFNFILLTNIFYPLFEKDIDEIIKNNNFLDFKSMLQQLNLKKNNELPEYKVINVEGPEHERIFTVEVFFGENKSAIGKGKTKKKAESKAAENILKQIKK